MALPIYPSSFRYFGSFPKRSGATFTPPNKGKLAGAFVDTNDSFRAKFNKNGVVVGLLDDGGGGVQRALLPNSKAYAMGLTAGGGAQGAVSLFTVTIPTTLTGFGGVLWYNLFVTDGTDAQTLTGMVTYSAVNKAGTLTETITELSTVQAKAVSTGTLTIAWTMTDAGSNSGLATIKANVTTSLNPTIDNLVYSVMPLAGPAIVTL